MHIVSHSKEDESDERLIQLDEVEDNFFVSHYPQKKKKRRWIPSSLDETRSCFGIQKSLKEKFEVPVRMTQHFEDNQTNGDCSVLFKDRSSTWEIKNNKNALRTGFFDVEMYRLPKRENAGITKSLDDGVDVFCFALQTTWTDKGTGEIRDTFIKEEFKEYSNKFFCCQTSILYRTMISEEMEMRLNPEKEAILFKVPIQHSMFKSYPLHWEEFGQMEQPSFYKDIFQ